MSQRVYTGPRRDRVRSPASSARRLPWILLVLTILAQIAWPLLDGDPLARLTVVTVVLGFLTSASHALFHRGAGFTAGWLIISAGIGFVAEWLGLRTDLPFGDYSYTDALGWEVAGVPVVIPLAWAMMSYPALLVSRRLVTGRIVTPLVGAIALASWDLFLDPQMVGEGYWTWASPDPHLVGIPGIPSQNFLGWLIVSVILMALLDRLPRRTCADGPPILFYLWTWLGGIIANAFFLDQPWVALWGGVVMGLVAVPVLVRTLSDGL